jgi:hypothetical protein
MRKKLLILAALLGIAAIPSWDREVLAVVYCNTACPSSPTNKCACPLYTGRPGATVYCYEWELHC